MSRADFFSGDLAEDIHDTLRAKELQLPIYFSQSPQLSSRRYLVDWLAIIADKFRVCGDAKQLCVFLLDYFMDKFDIVDRQLKLVGLGCLLVAAKFECQDSEIPKASSLNRYVGPQGYTLHEFLMMELTLLDFFRWNVSLPTPSNFVNYYLKFAVAETDFHISKPITELDVATRYMEKYVAYFIEISTQDHCYREFLPSLIGAGSIAAARICLQISPIWSQGLESITRYSFQEVEPVIKVMLRTHEFDEILAKRRKGSSLSSTPEMKEKLDNSTDYDVECPQVVASQTKLEPTSCYTAHSVYYMSTAVRLP